MGRPRRINRIISSNIDQLASDLAMAVWNHLAGSHHFRHLHPQDYPELYEAVQKSLRPYCAKPDDPLKGEVP